MRRHGRQWAAQMALYVRMAGAAALLAAAAGCAQPDGPDTAAVDPDVQYVLDKLNRGSREERGDALEMLVTDRQLYAVAEPQLRRMVVRENDLFLRERLIDGLGAMATARLWGAAQQVEYGIPRQAAAIGYRLPEEPPEDDPTVALLARLIHESNPYIVAHARAARARLGVREGFWGLILALDDRDTYPEMADLSLQLLREVTGLHLTGKTGEWWKLFQRTQPGERYIDADFDRRAAAQAGM